MGITIHYSGKLDDLRVLPDLLTAARHFCFQRRWRYVNVDDRILGTVERWVPDEDKRVHTIIVPIDDILRGLIIRPHPRSESVFLTFNQEGELCFYMPQARPGLYWENKPLFTKTQFAPLDIHISICELFQLLRDNYFPNLHVEDEGEYWETRDPARLAEKRERLNALIDQITSALQDPNHPLTQEIQSLLGNDTAHQQEGLHCERGASIKVSQPLWKRGHGRSAGRN